MAWRDVHCGTEQDGLTINGVDVWGSKWRRTKDPTIKLPHPQHPGLLCGYHVYEIGDVNHPVRFAAGELSYGAWGFYVPEPE